jgi:uncharacterized protein (DUF2267 family)
MNRDEFVERVRREIEVQLDGGEIEGLIRTVLTALRRFITEGEMEDVRSILPKDVRVLVP